MRYHAHWWLAIMPALSSKLHALTLCGLIVGVMLVIVGILMCFLIKRASAIQPRSLPEDTNECNMGYSPYDYQRAEELPQQVYDYTFGTNHWPPVDVYGYGWFPPAPTNSVVAYELIAMANIAVEMSSNMVDWVTAGVFANGDTNAAYTNAFATLRMKPDLSGVDIQQTPWARTNIGAMFFRPVPLQ